MKILHLFVLMLAAAVGLTEALEVVTCPPDVCSKHGSCPEPRNPDNPFAAKSYTETDADGNSCVCFCAKEEKEACESKDEIDDSCKKGTFCGYPPKSTGETPVCCSNCFLKTCDEYEKCKIDTDGQAQCIIQAPANCKDNVNYSPVRAFNRTLIRHFPTMSVITITAIVAY